MDKHLVDNLAKRFPVLFEYYLNKHELVYAISYGIETGNGWLDIITEALVAIQKEVDAYPPTLQSAFKLHQIKEKFGSLRIHMEVTDDTINNIIREVESYSSNVCATCGSLVDVTQNTHGFVRSLCTQCMDEFKSRDYKLNGEL